MLIPALLLIQHIAVADLPNSDKNPFTTPQDVQQGGKLYAGRCAGCHGPSGDGGKGTNLATPSLPRATTDAALFRIIQYGLPDTEMPRHNMTRREIWQIAAFVRTLGRAGEGAARGDATRGEALFRGKGACRGCHLIDGEGGHTGPSLTGIGGRRSRAYLRTKLIDPGRELAGDFSLVKLTTRSGQRISGIRLNEDTWSIQVRDMNLGLHSFQKDDLTELAIERRTVMPSYAGQLTGQEIDDIVTYLSGKGDRK